MAEPEVEAPPLSNEPNRRPNTIAPVTFVSITDEDLLRMNDTQLVEFADRMLGIVIPLGTKRTTILTKIINASVVVRDGR